MSNERHLKEIIRKQSDKIKELEADFNDEFVKGQMKTLEIERLNNLLQSKKKRNGKSL